MRDNKVVKSIYKDLFFCTTVNYGYTFRYIHVAKHLYNRWNPRGFCNLIGCGSRRLCAIFNRRHEILNAEFILCIDFALLFEKIEKRTTCTKFDSITLKIHDFILGKM